MDMLALDPDDRPPRAEIVIAALLNCPQARVDARDEVVRTHRERFPRPGDQPRRTASVPAMAPPMTDAQPVTLPAISCTLGTAASPSIPNAVPVRRGRMLVAFIVGACVVGGLVGAVLALRKTSHKDRTPNVPSTSSDRVAVHQMPVASVESPAPADAAAASLDAVVLDTTVAVTPPDAPLTHVPSNERSNRPNQKPHRGSSGGERTRPDPVASSPRGTGELAVIAKPSAQIWIDGKPAGHTPYREQLPAGKHRLRLMNEDVGKDESLTITIEPDKTLTVEKNWK